MGRRRKKRRTLRTTEGTPKELATPPHRLTFETDSKLIKVTTNIRDCLRTRSIRSCLKCCRWHECKTRLEGIKVDEIILKVSWQDFKKIERDEIREIRSLTNLATFPLLIYLYVEPPYYERDKKGEIKGVIEVVKDKTTNQWKIDMFWYPLISVIPYFMRYAAKDWTWSWISRENNKK